MSFPSTRVVTEIKYSKYDLENLVRKLSGAPVVEARTPESDKPIITWDADGACTISWSKQLRTDDPHTHVMPMQWEALKPPEKPAT